MDNKKWLILIAINALVILLLVCVNVVLAQAPGQGSPPAEPTPQIDSYQTSELNQPEEPSVALSPLLQYQGRLTNPATGLPISNGSIQMTFRLYDSSGSNTALWTEMKNIQVTSGLFSTALGDTTPFSQALFNGRALWLGVQVGGDPEALPRQQVVSVAYALSLLPGAVISTTSTTPSLSGYSAGNGANFSTSSTSAGKAGVFGVAASASGILPSQESGVFGSSANGNGVSGTSSSQIGVYGYSTSGYGLRGDSANSIGVYGLSVGSGYAGYFYSYKNYGGYFYGGGGKAIYASGSITATGNIKSSGTVSGQYTALPLAYGHVYLSGSLASGSPNVSSVWNTNHYEITITGETYYYTDYVTTVTLTYGCPSTYSVRDTSGSGQLRIYVFNSGGSNVQCEFEFITYKP
jgi:hypothetical protein